MVASFCCRFWSSHQIPQQYWEWLICADGILWWTFNQVNVLWADPITSWLHVKHQEVIANKTNPNLKSCWHVDMRTLLSAATDQWQVFGAAWDPAAVRKHNVDAALVWRDFLKHDLFSQADWWGKEADLWPGKQKCQVTGLQGQLVVCWWKRSYSEGWLWEGNGDYLLDTLDCFTANWAHSCYSYGQRDHSRHYGGGE